jgi:simple sugar transport system permease protein
MSGAPLEPNALETPPSRFTGAQPAMKSTVIGVLSAHPELSPFIILVIVTAIFAAANPAFFSSYNVSGVLAYMPELGIMALGMTLLITAGEFDLSVGAVFALAPIIMLLLMGNLGVPLGIAAMIALLVSLGIGVVNGLLVTKVKITSFLVTLAMLLIVRGVALFITNGFPQKPPPVETFVGHLFAGSMAVGTFTVYASLLWFVVLAVALHLVLGHTRFGNWVTATGSNAAAAVARGVPTDRVKVVLFALTSLLAGFSGMISAFRVASAAPIAGTAYELEVIAMVVVGGTTLTGGRGTIIGTVIGVTLLRIIRNGIVLVGVPGLAYNIFIGLIILGMLIVHSALDRFSLVRR